MPIEAWADDFDARLRFGIPTLPPSTQHEGTAMPPTAITLPPRAGAFRYSDEDVRAVLSIFTTLPAGQAVALQDAPEDSENKARRKCQIIREQIEALPLVRYDVPEDELGAYGEDVLQYDSEEAGGAAYIMTAVIDPAYYVRGHVIGHGDRKEDGTYAAYMPAVSLSKRGEAASGDADAAAPDTADAAPDDDAAAAPAPADDAAAAPATDATDATAAPKRSPRGRNRA